jgi:hypothetical protein
MEASVIVEIGLLLALYVIARLTSTARPLIARTTAGLAIAVALLVGADLAMRGFTSQGVIEQLTAESGPEGDDEASNESADAEKTPPKLTGSVTHVDGGSITTQLGYGIAVAKGSSLKREWIAVQEPSAPAQFEGTPGVATVYDSKQYGGDYLYRAKFKLAFTSDVRAFEVRFLLFNVWGEHVTNLVSSEVEDVASGGTKEYAANWNVTASDVAEHYASIAYVARVRLADGRIIEAPIETVLDEARKFSAKFTAEQLEPKP